ncbi:hypothetical protein HanRHA438_Chr01g0002681 [Helianthus annuus]|nr:hypothetical protein HanRHA438_Chr01g0002681 [Helianthus annuus]
MGYQYIVMNTPTNIISFYFEDLVNFLTDCMEGISTLRPADLLVFGWVRGKHACVDLRGVSPLVGLRENGFVAPDKQQERHNRGKLISTLKLIQRTSMFLSILSLIHLAP